jgi:hypothetical protein
MKKFLGVLIILLCVLFSATPLLADTTACKVGQIDSNGIQTFTWELLDTDSDGIVTGSYCGPIATGLLYSVRLIPDDSGTLVIDATEGATCSPAGDCQPSDNWDAEVQDQYGYDVLEGVGADVTNVFTTTRQYRTPVTTDSSGNNVGHIYLNGVKLRGYASGLGANNGCRIEISIKVQDAIRKGR